MGTNEVLTQIDFEDSINRYERLVEDIRQLCELDGTNRVVDAIRRRIDNERYR